MKYLMVPTEHSKVLCDSKSNSWIYNTCTTGAIIESVIKFAILNFCLLPRVVFVRTEEQVDMKWTQSLKSIKKDYGHGLVTMNPKNLSDDEDEKRKAAAAAAVKS